MTSWLSLAAAIASEVAGTLSLRSWTDQHRPWTLAVVIVGYGLSFWLLAVALRSLNVGIVYAIWAGLGTAATALLANRLFGDPWNLTATVGVALIVGGVTVVAVSGVASHG